jgi:hypothetical protein
MSTVLIAIDHTIRELFGAELLAHYLRAAGHRTALCSTITFGDYYSRYRPDAVVFPNAVWDLSWVAERSLVFVIPSESGVGQPASIALLAGTPRVPAYPKPVTRFFCWGPAMRDILLETGAWSEEQLVATGTPTTDHWLLPPPPPAPDRHAGVTTTLRTISSSAPPAKWNVFDRLDDVERLGGDGQYYLPPEHAEAWFFVEASFARVVIGLCRVLAVERTYPIEIRPHPFEMVKRYEFFRRLPGGRVSVRKSGTISEWLERINLLFTFMSASSLDAVVRGVPVVSLMGLMDPDARRKMPHTLKYSFEPWLWPLEHMAQATEYMEEATRGRLAPCRDEAAMAGFLADHFAYPRPRPAAAAVAEHISEVLAVEGPRFARADRRRPVRGVRRLRDAAAHAVPLAAAGIAVARYLHGRLPGQVEIGHLYWPWNWQQRRTALRAVDAVAAVESANPVHDGLAARVPSSPS